MRWTQRDYVWEAAPIGGVEVIQTSAILSACLMFRSKHTHTTTTQAHLAELATQRKGGEGGAIITRHLRDEEGDLRAGMSQRTRRPKRSNSYARSRALRLGEKPVT
jgi:hypothetical protein